MERVTGIGGVFFRAKNPKALAEWYENHLGVTQTPTSYDAEPWKQDAGAIASATSTGVVVGEVRGFARR